MERPVASILFVAALGCLAGAALLLLGGFIEYLQAGSWRSPSLLEVAYDNYLIRARWFIAHPWSWWLHDLLESVPVFAALLVAGPCAWWASNRLRGR